MEQKPSVGRIVHYQSYGTPGGEHPSMARAAIITDIAGVAQDPGYEAPAVSLAVFNPDGIFLNKRVPYNADGKPGTWRWPPRA